jgi:hypothetical protein
MDVLFHWNSGIAEADFSNLKSELNYELPREYIDFINVTNGAIMFKDSLFGQWGYEFLQVQDILHVTKNVRELGYLFPETCVVVAKSFGDGDMLLLDLKRSSSGEAYIIDGEQGYQYEDWGVINCTFDKFIDRLIVSQGAKFWRWK